MFPLGKSVVALVGVKRGRGLAGADQGGWVVSVRLWWCEFVHAESYIPVCVNLHVYVCVCASINVTRTRECVGRHRQDAPLRFFKVVWKVGSQCQSLPPSSPRLTDLNVNRSRCVTELCVMLILHQRASKKQIVIEAMCNTHTHTPIRTRSIVVIQTKLVSCERLRRECLDENTQKNIQFTNTVVPKITATRAIVCLSVNATSTTKKERKQKKNTHTEMQCINYTPLPSRPHPFHICPHVSGCRWCCFACEENGRRTANRGLKTDAETKKKNAPGSSLL